MEETFAFTNKTMHAQIMAFEKKVTLSLQNFSVRTMHDMLTSLRNRPPTRALGRIDNIGKLRDVVTREADRVRIDYGIVTEQGDPVLIYFNWFFDYFRYLKELRKNFERKVYIPLQEYFYGNFQSPFQNRLPDSRVSTTEGKPIHEILGISPSAASSRLSSGLSHASVMSTNTPITSREALRKIAREFKEIEQVYDNSEIERVAARLMNVRDSWSVLLEDETEITPHLFSPESETMVQGVAGGRGVTSLLRLVPDILVKCKQATALARQWLEIDARKSRKLTQKLHQIKAVHQKITRKLESINSTIEVHESELQREADELQRLLKLEERSTDLNTQLYNSEQDISTLKTAYENARAERDVLTKELFECVRTGAKSFDSLKVRYEQNRLTRHMLQRKLASTKYQRAVLSGDMQVEVDLRPTIVRFTNHVQDKCERLEQQLEQEREERKLLENALLPLREDRQSIEREMLQQSMEQSPPLPRKSLGIQTNNSPPDVSTHNQSPLANAAAIDRRRVMEYKDKPLLADSMTSYEFVPSAISDVRSSRQSRYRDASIATHGADKRPITKESNENQSNIGKPRNQYLIRNIVRDYKSPEF